MTSAIFTGRLSTRDSNDRRSPRRAPTPMVGFAIVGLAVFALICTGCSKTPAGTGASSDGVTSAAGEQAVKFAQCMRDNGVREFPDPDASGTLTIETIVNGTSIDTESPAFQQAITACKHLEPSGFTGFARTPQQQQAALKFAECIRDNGVQDFPDPAIDDPLVDTNRIPSTATSSGMSILNAAMQTCSAFARDAGAN
jgi:hypothetical protein